MAILLSDVGGTNARLALAGAGGIDAATLRRFRGDDFASYDAVITRYLDEMGRPAVEAVCVAVAGPVAGGQARLTNRDWDFSEIRLAALAGAPRARLINDLTALGYATPYLSGDGLGVVRAAPDDRPRNGQSLVVGLGTGFNVCSVRKMPDGRVIGMEAEEGHTHLPANIHARLVAELGNADAFFSTEETFAGRGLARLHAALHGLPEARAEAVAAAMEAGDPAAERTYGLFTELVGLLLRELALRFMPLDGLYLAGSVSRSIADRADTLERALLAQPYMRHIPANTPILLIRDDMAALHGCLAAVR